MGLDCTLLVPWDLVWGDESTNTIYIDTKMCLPRYRRMFDELRYLKSKQIQHPVLYEERTHTTDSYGSPLVFINVKDVIKAMQPYIDNLHIRAAVAYLKELPKEAVVIPYWY